MVDDEIVSKPVGTNEPDVPVVVGVADNVIDSLYTVRWPIDAPETGRY